MDNYFSTIDIPTVKIDLNDFKIHGYSLYLRREDLIHPQISGNKFRKLKYNFEEAKMLKKASILTFGGAYSNHIAAVAAAGNKFGIKTIGIIRGEEIANKIDKNPTLSFAQRCGMELNFVTREDYKHANEESFIEKLREKFVDFYLLPEGGANSFAVKGCEEIVKKNDGVYNYLCVSVGTGGTLAGLVKASEMHQKVLGFSALKGTFQTSEVEKYTLKTNFEITDDYCFGGYGKIDEELVRFINEFKRKTDIQLDPVYTGKMLFGIMDLLKNGHFPENSSILAIHTGGLQGIAGMNQKLKKKKLPILQ